jgi:hypothetical protein
MWMKKYLLLLALILGFALSSGFAQSNEIGATIGGQFVFGSYDVGKSGAFEINPAHRIFNAEVASLYVEVPLTWTFNTYRVDPLNLVHDHYSSFFITPGLKLKVLPQLPISPYGFVGVGLARYHDTNTDSASYGNVVDYGAGLDWKVAPVVSLRGELRDYNASLPSLSFPLPGSRQQSLSATVGLDFRF